MKKGKLQYQPIKAADGNYIVVACYRFSDEEKAYIFANYRSMTYGEIAKKLNRTRNSVCGFVRRHKLVKKVKQDA